MVLIFDADFSIIFYFRKSHRTSHETYKNILAIFFGEKSRTNLNFRGVSAENRRERGGGEFARARPSRAKRGEDLFRTN